MIETTNEIKFSQAIETMKKESRFIILLLILITLCIVVILIETKTHTIRRIFDDFIYDNKNHYLPCEKLPTKVEVNKIIREKNDVIKEIEAVNPGFVEVEIDSSTCQGKADIIFWYASHENRLEIEDIIGDETFFGIPYRLQNR
ncbi:MAG: hypothetical protein CVU41_14170 [Chloroflexi bacterium HGW-Chloroflexi-3]|nr:MAG: hypothetical protein CVU41_14170 [Chloroflexi bacterium HGW-Chloroflexi-3]